MRNTLKFNYLYMLLVYTVLLGTIIFAVSGCSVAQTCHIENDKMICPDGSSVDVGAKDGKDGRDGREGQPGSNGQNGLAGSNGGPGATGLTGPQGATGATGATGAQGVQGVQGPQGPQGNPGTIGHVVSETQTQYSSYSCLDFSDGYSVMTNNISAYCGTSDGYFYDGPGCTGNPTYWSLYNCYYSYTSTSVTAPNGNIYVMSQPDYWSYYVNITRYYVQP